MYSYQHSSGCVRRETVGHAPTKHPTMLSIASYKDNSNIKHASNNNSIQLTEHLHVFVIIGIVSSAALNAIIFVGIPLEVSPPGASTTVSILHVE